MLTYKEERSHRFLFINILLYPEKNSSHWTDKTTTPLYSCIYQHITCATTVRSCSYCLVWPGRLVTSDKKASNKKNLKKIFYDMMVNKAIIIFVLFLLIVLPSFFSCTHFCWLRLYIMPTLPRSKINITDFTRSWNAGIARKLLCDVSLQ